MASTELRKNGTNVKRLTDKQVRFVLEYLTDYNGTRSAIAAGYNKNRAAPTACDLLKNPKVKALVGKLRREQAERFQIQADEVLRHLASGATRDTWISEARFIQESITDNDIDYAVKKMPSEIYYVVPFIWYL